MKIFFVGLRQFVLSIGILLGILVFAGLGVSLLKEIDPSALNMLISAGPTSVFSWLILLVIVGLYPLALAVWVMKDATKFKKQGINTMPIVWAIGTLLPTILIVFPVYYVVREVVWMRRIGKGVEPKFEQKQSATKENGGQRASRGLILNYLVVIFVVYVVVMATDLPNKLNKGNVDEQVAKIHATKLTLDDVMGKNLPPDPGTEADKTVQGIDANKNGIRDDVELAIFKEYPNSAKTRAVLLQYALALQMGVLQPIVNKETVTEVVTEQSRGSQCVGDELVPRSPSGSSRTYSDVEKINAFIDFVEEIQLNTEGRKESQNSFYKYLGSYSDSTNAVCDIESSGLLN